jgi:hypothetical protein
LTSFCQVLCDKYLLRVVFQIFFGHVDSIFNFPIFKSANELTFAIVDGSNDMGSIYNTQKRDNKIHSFWTFDGRILAKKGCKRSKTAQQVSSGY